MSWERAPNGLWMHRPWWKVAINTCLRWVQPGPVKWVVYSDCAPGDPPVVVGYGFGPVLHLS